MRANQIIALALLLIVLTSELVECCRGRWPGWRGPQLGRFDASGRVVAQVKLTLNST